MLRRTDKFKVISARRKLKGQKVSGELTQSNFLLLKNLQEHNLIINLSDYMPLSIK
jgi:hypothetical protein